MRTSDIKDILKDFVLDNVRAELAALDEDDIAPVIEEKHVVYGVADLSRHEAKVVCSILPERQDVAEGDICGLDVRQEVTVTFLFQKAPYDELMDTMTLYSDAFRRALAQDTDMGGRIKDSEFGGVKFWTDAGATAFQMTAAEISLTLIISEEFD